MDGINVIVKDEFAQPLSGNDMKKFMNHLNSCNIQFDKKKHKDYIIKLASKLLPNKNKIDEFTKSVKDMDFYQSYQYLREEYQEEYPFRIGICDGAHRITAMFNVIYGIQLKSNGLSLVSDRPDVKDLCNLEAIAGCEVWEYKSIRESIKIKQNFKINQYIIFINNLYRIFYSNTTHWLHDVSANRQHQSKTRVKNTHLSCVMTSLNVITKHCSEFEKSIVKASGMNTNNITTTTKLEIPKYVSNSKYEDLNKILGAALPEATQSRYYGQTENERKTTITLKDLRHLIMWQLWITHFMDHYPNFHTEMERSYERGKFDQIGKLVFKKIGIENMKPEHLCIHNPRKPREVAEKAKNTKKYQNSLQAYEEEKKTNG